MSERESVFGRETYGVAVSAGDLRCGDRGSVVVPRVVVHLALDHACPKPRKSVRQRCFLLSFCAKGLQRTGLEVVAPFADLRRGGAFVQADDDPGAARLAPAATAAGVAAAALGRAPRPPAVIEKGLRVSTRQADKTSLV